LYHSIYLLTSKPVSSYFSNIFVSYFNKKLKNTEFVNILASSIIQNHPEISVTITRKLLLFSNYQCIGSSNHFLTEDKTFQLAKSTNLIA